MNRLSHSGIMTSYVCGAKCRHCMVCSTPSIDKEFISAEAADRIARALSGAGVTAMHIGGGEPFLNFDSLRALLIAMKKHRVAVDYIETNASWCIDEKIVAERLRELKSLGAHCVMASVDPFHIEFVPLERPLLLVRQLRAAGLDYFIWQERFLRRLMPLDHTRPIPHEELKRALGDDYVEEAAREYGLGINGRALRIARALYPARPAEQLRSAAPCDLLSGRHCHVDLYEQVLPSGCPGIAIELNDYLRGNVPAEKYPVAARLMSGGVDALYRYAEAHGFTPSERGYVTACELCYALRDFLRDRAPSADIGPNCFYRAMGDEITL